MHQSLLEPSTKPLTRKPRPKPQRRAGELQTITVADIESMDRKALSDLWGRCFGTAVPAQMSQPILRRFLSYEVQAKAQGNVSPALLAKLERVAAGRERPSTPALQPGARLLREWNGTTHVVDVLEDGFIWNGRKHRSLSAIAREITGARWSGPRFFGMTAQKKAPCK